MSDLVAVDSEVFQRFLAAADDDNLVDDPTNVSMDIIAKILGATDAAGVLGREEATHARNYLDTPFALTGVKFNRSGFEGDGPQFYAVLSGANQDGEPVTITCGAKNVIAQAWKLADLQALPLKVIIRQNPKPTAAGYHVMWLEAADEGY